MNVSRAVIRQLSSSTKSNIHPGFKKIKVVQEKFQKNDGKPIFLKGGAFDQILYRTTMGLCLVGMGGMIKLFWDLAVPKSVQPVSSIEFRWTG